MQSEELLGCLKSYMFWKATTNVFFISVLHGREWHTTKRCICAGIKVSKPERKLWSLEFDKILHGISIGHTLNMYRRTQ